MNDIKKPNTIHLEAERIATYFWNKAETHPEIFGERVKLIEDVLSRLYEDGWERGADYVASSIQDVGNAAYESACQGR